jgi:hypothetical protein
MAALSVRKFPFLELSPEVGFMPARRNPQDTASSTGLLQFFRALDGGMVG